MNKSLFNALFDEHGSKLSYSPKKDAVFNLLKNNLYYSISAVDSAFDPLEHLVAMMCHDEDIITALFDSGADLFCDDGNGYFPIHSAAREDNLVFLKIMIEKYGVEPNISSRDEKEIGETPFLISSWSNNIVVMEWLTKDAHVDINHCDNYGMTALFYHAMKPSLTQEDIETMRWLVNYGIDLNHPDRIDWTALHWAANSNNLDAVKFLIEECHMNPVCDFGNGTPAEAAEGNDDIERYFKSL